MITKKEVAALLTRCASSSSDQRTIGHADVEDWYEIAVMHRWSYPVARRIIVEHIGSGAGRPRITEADITDRTRVLRSAAAASYVEPPIPDDLLARDYPAWHRAHLTAHIDRVLEKWVQTGIEPDSHVSYPQLMPDPNGQARVQQLISGVFAAITRDEADPGDTRRRSALRRPCSFCGAKANEPCTRVGQSSKRVRLRKVHPARAEEAA